VTITIDVQAAFENDPPALDFVWPGFLAGTVGALVAPGGVGKSFWALEAAMAVAGGDAPGSDLLGLGPSRAGRVVYFAGEDPAPILDCRIHAIGRHLSDTARSAIAGRMTVEPVAGSSMNVTDRHTLHQLVEKCSGARLVVLDTLSRMHRLDENSNGDMAVVVACLERLALETGASVLFLHHVSKGSAREGATDHQGAARGASALVDNARWCGFIAPMASEEASRLGEEPKGVPPIGEARRRHFVRFGVSKQNYGSAPPDRWYSRDGHGVLLPAALSAAEPTGRRKGAHRAQA
jgi:RecA-family ATPase